MAKESQSQSRADYEEVLVQSAVKKAAIISWLNQNPGKHGGPEISRAIGGEVGPITWACKQLAKSGQIGHEGGGGRGNKVLYFSKENGPVGDSPQTVSPVRPRRVRPEPTRQVELVMAGFEIVIGRNPLTGRLRITLEG